MKRLIPGKVRYAGLELYESGLVELQDQTPEGLAFVVGGKHLFYAQSSHKTLCDCSLFPEKGYCEHLAAVEAYVNYQLKGDFPNQLDEFDKESGKRAEFVQTSLFLDKLPIFSSSTSLYRDKLSVSGEWDSYAKDMVWTLKISRHPFKRAYVIRDIPSFLSMVEQGANYQVGQSSSEPLSYQQFDPASQLLLNFIKFLLPNKTTSLFSSNRYLRLPSYLLREGLDIFQSLSDFELEVNGQVFRQLSFQPLIGYDALFNIEVQPDLEEIILSFTAEPYLPVCEGSVLFRQGNFYQLDFEQSLLLKQLQTLPLNQEGKRLLHFSWDDQEKVAELLEPLRKLGQVHAPVAFQVSDFRASFSFSLDAQQMLCLRTVYEGEIFSVSDQASFDVLPLTLNLQKRQAIEALLTDFGFESAFEGRRPRLSPADLFAFFHHFLPALRALGQVELTPELENLWLVESPQINLDLTGQFLEVDFDTSLLSPDELQSALVELDANRPYQLLPSGQVLAFSPEFLSLIEELRSLGARQSDSGAYVLPALAALRLNASLSGYDNLRSSEQLKDLHRHLSQPESFPLPELAVKAQLRDYQLKGVQWLSVLDHYGFGGVLADDMGLGKTLQTIAFLSSRLTGQQKALILAPASLVYNWQEEFAKFFPEARVTLVYGAKAERLSLLEEASQIFITSYHSFRQDILDYQVRDFDYLILDEAQVLKNHQTKLSKLLATFKTKRVFALSGTPIENRLLEVWSLFEIVLPGLFGSKKTFASLSPQEVAQIIQPFVLRRTKEEVLTELPLLTEVVYQNELSSQQKSLYLAQLQQLKEQVSTMTDKSFSQQRMAVLAGLTRLRQICDSPALFMPYEGESGKLDSLTDLLQQLKANGHRVLIFSQFRGMLDMVEETLADLGLSSFKITGSTPSQERQTITKVFNKGSRDAVLISLKAGGVGLNLTGADVVVLVDLWWNPAVDLQAIGRAHRLGQTKQVTVYRLITHGTIEEKILQLQEQKRDLINQVLRTEENKQDLTLDDIRDILGIFS